MCLYPRLIKNNKYTPNIKNNGIVPTCKDDRMLLVPIGCGKCIECKKQKAREWIVRLGEDVKYNTNGVFVTLTFNDKALKELSNIILKENKLQGYELDNAIAKLAVKRFRERWRKRTGKSPRHWLITELGHNGTERIHLHGIIWTDEREYIEKQWEYGYVWVQNKNKNVGGAITNYITKYITKTDTKHKEYKGIILTSAGIGKKFIENDKIGYYKYNEKETKEQYRTNQGIKKGMPVYYRNKLWTEQERENLWINRLNEEKRFILGKEISIKNGLEEYYRILHVARQTNKRLGYGDDEKNWTRIAYENSVRNTLKKNIKNKSQINLEIKNNSNTFDISKYETNYKQLKNVF